MLCSLGMHRRPNADHEDEKGKEDGTQGSNRPLNRGITQAEWPTAHRPQQLDHDEYGHRLEPEGDPFDPSRLRGAKDGAKGHWGPIGAPSHPIGGVRGPREEVTGRPVYCRAIRRVAGERLTLPSEARETELVSGPGAAVLSTTIHRQRCETPATSETSQGK